MFKEIGVLILLPLSIVVVGPGVFTVPGSATTVIVEPADPPPFTGGQPSGDKGQEVREPANGHSGNGNGVVSAAAPSVSSFTLINANTHQEWKELKDGATIDLAMLPGVPLNIRANSTPGTTGSIVFDLQGVQHHRQTENLLPYALFGDDTRGRYFGSQLPAGQYVLTATPYSGEKGTGKKGSPLVVHFQVIYGAAVTGFTLVNADTDKEIGPLKEGDVVDLATLWGARLNIRANVAPGRVGSTVLQLGGAHSYRRTENGPPYALYGDKGGDYLGFSPQAGAYELTATPYSAAHGGGAKGTPLTIRFKVAYTAAIQRFTLVNAESGTDIRQLQDGDVVDLSTLPTTTLNIRADSDPGKVGSVAFDLSGAQTHQHTEQIVPYALFADDTKGTYYGAYFQVGAYTLTATPYSASRAQGAQGQPLTIHFTVQEPGTGCSTPGFGPPITYPSGSNNPEGIVAGDFNGDGKPDLAFANSIAGGNIGLLRNTGDGLFAAPVSFPSGGDNPEAIGMGDFNGDGKPDLVAVNAQSGNLGVLLNKGNGSFAAPVVYPSGGSLPVAITIADFNKDGTQDMAVINFFDASVGVLQGRGDGSFKAPSLFSTGGGYVTDIASGDFNGDGHMDLVVSNADFVESTDSDNIGLLLGNGDGSFAAPTLHKSYGSNRSPLTIVAADFNGDKKLDLAVGNEGNATASNNIGILLGTGTGGFFSIIANGNNDYVNDLVAGDYNDDGNMDLAYANPLFFGGNLGYLLGNGDGSFGQPVTFPGGGERPKAILTADLNGDGALDMATTHNFSHSVSTLFNLCGSGNHPVVTRTRAEQKPLQPQVAIKGGRLDAAPNPFTAQTTIRFSLENAGYATLALYNTAGQEIARLYQGQMEAAQEYRATLAGTALAPGMYLLRLTTERNVMHYKVVLTR